MESFIIIAYLMHFCAANYYNILVYLLMLHHTLTFIIKVHYTMIAYYSIISNFDTTAVKGLNIQALD